MSIRLTYRCPGANGHGEHTFSYFHHPDARRDPPPRYCPVCGWDSHGTGMDEELATPHIASARAVVQSVDGIHRGMEEGAQFRADVAAERFGLSSEEAAALRETNMADGLREGDTSNVPVDNDVSRLVEAAPDKFGFRDPNAGLYFSGTVGEGVNPNAGAKTQAAVRSMHAKVAAVNGMPNATLSHRPALETVASNYRVRVR